VTSFVRLLVRATTLLALLLGGLSTIAAPSSAEGGAVDTYVPTTGAKFNNPLGDVAAQRRLFTHIVRTVNSVPAGQTIRFAVFSFADKQVADALLAAYHRGVHVKLIFSSREIYAPMTRLRSVFGRDPDARSFAVFCQASCRGTEGEMHAKYFSFSGVGGGHRYVTMVGSNNLTRHNAEDQWSDLYTVAGDAAYFNAYVGWFTQMKYDKPIDSPYVHRFVSQDQVMLTPVDFAVQPDPIRTALGKVACETAKGLIDPDAADPDRIIRTKIFIAAHAWNGERGKLVARDVAALARAGCKVRLFYGVGTGPAVRTIVESAGAALTNGTHRGKYTHQKMMVIWGNYAGHVDTVRVWTGSHNWSDRAQGRDDVIVQIKRPEIGAAYIAGFKWMWLHG
jgi:PLD-like domain